MFMSHKSDMPESSKKFMLRAADETLKANRIKNVASDSTTKKLRMVLGGDTS